MGFRWVSFARASPAEVGQFWSRANKEELILKPIGPGGGGQAPMPFYLRQVIARLKAIFGEATPLVGQVLWVLLFRFRFWAR